MTTLIRTDELSDELPHDAYMDAVAHALTARGIVLVHWEASLTDDDEPIPDAYFTWQDAITEEWPHGVYLIWDSCDGWRLVETGGGRNIYSLSEDSRTYSDPRQVAADVDARITHGMGGWTPGPICIIGDLWDSEATQAAVEAWVMDE
ncbi:MAG TPA: DUF6292 family protein [Gemmatimonadales bacterium]